MQRDNFLSVAGTIESVFGFIDMIAQSKRAVEAPIPGQGSGTGMTGDFLRGHTLQSDRPPSKRTSAAKDDRDKKGKDEATGSALRSVYDKTVNEPVPDQMLDLLRKLD